MFQTELVKYATGQMGNHVINAGRLMIEAKHRWKNCDANFRQLMHVFEVDWAERALPRHQYELSPLFDDHIGGACYKIV